VKVRIVLMGATLPFTIILQAGPLAIAQAMTVAVSTFVVIYFAATRLFGLDPRFAATLRGRRNRRRGAWYTWYIQAVASGRIAVANGRIFPLKPPDPRPFPSLCVRLRPSSTPAAKGSIPGASTSQPTLTAGSFLVVYQRRRDSDPWR
jgi:hypothetical protein